MLPSGLPEGEKNLYEYHNVFANALAVYLNLRKETESETFSGGKSAEIKRREALSILESCTLYAITLKRNDLENKDIPTHDPLELALWYKEYKEELKKKGLDDTTMLATLYNLMVRKQEVAGLTANSEKTMTSRMNMLISQVESEKRREER